MNKIIFVTNYFGNGGAATVMKIIAEYMIFQKYEIELVAFLDNDDKYSIPDGIKYKVLNEKNKIKRIFALRKYLKNQSAIIISFEYFVNMQTIIANLFLKNKLIISERNDPSRVGNEKKIIRNFLYRFCDKLVCQTQEAKEYFPQYIQKKTNIIFNPIKENLPEPYNGERNKTIVTFCRVEKQKNLTLMIDAFKKVNEKYPEYKLVIYGNGNEKQKILDYIKINNLQNIVIMNPFTPNLHEEILKCSMFVSSSDYEGISNSMLEAMAIGLPTICTDCPCGGARMMIENNKNGILTKVGDVNELSSAIIKVIENPEFSNFISQNGKKIREKLESKKICEEWENVIERL